MDGAALLRELDSLRAALAGRAGANRITPAGRQDRLIVLARFLSEHASAAWNDPAAHAGNGDQGSWFALELDPEEYPQMRGLCRADAPPLGPVCPLTAALLPESFLRRVAEEVSSLSATGGEATLAIFAVDKTPAPETSPGSCPRPCGDRSVDSFGCGGTTSGADRRPDRQEDQREGAFPPSSADAPLRVLARIMRRHARSCDIPGRPARDHLALLMPGMGPFRARALAERLIASFQEETGPTGGALRAGLACCDADAPVTADVLLAQAEAALARAQPGFSRTFRQAGAPEPERRTQVQACEKAFLFFGDSEQV